MKKILFSALTFLAFGVTAQVHFTGDFENGQAGWDITDQDGDGNNWLFNDLSTIFAGVGTGSVYSFSETNAQVALTPDNFLTTSAPIDLTSASATNLVLSYVVGNYRTAPKNEEHYAVYLTTSNNPNDIASATPVFEETIGMEQVLEARTIDASAYAGQNVYLTFRHFNCTAEYVLIIDNVSIANLLDNDAGIEDVLLPRYAAINTNNTLDIAVKNTGGNAITSLDIEWNDGTAHSATITTNIAPGATVVVSHPDAINEATAVEKSIDVTITGVNGTADADPSNNDADALFNTVSQIVDKAVVIEEGTGTWCGWCPRGEIAMDYMYDTYSRDQFIGIAVHNGDPMTLAAYDGNMGLTGYPGCNVDRSILGASVSQGLFEQYYNERKDLISPAAMDVQTSLDATTNEATIVVTANFKTVFSSANYRIGVIVVEDQVQNDAYNQVNYYAGGGNGPMGGFENLPDPVPGSQMVYDHVGRALLGGFAGQASSVPASIADGDAVTYTFNYTVPAGSFGDKMRVIPVLIDQNTGEIVNASYKNMDGTLGLAEAAPSIELTVFPNPASDVVNVAFEAGENTDYAVTISDMAGRELSTTAFSGLNGTQSLEIPVSELTAGQYLLTVSTTGVSYAKVLVIQ